MVRSIEVFAEPLGWGMYILQSPVHQLSPPFKVLWKAKGEFQPFFALHACTLHVQIQCACTHVRTFIWWWLHITPFWLIFKFQGQFLYKKPAENMEAWKHLSKIQHFWFMTIKYLNQEYLSFLKSGQYVWSQICGVRPAQNVLATAHLFYKSIWRRICNRLSHLCTLWLSRIIVLKFTGIESDIKNRVISRK